MLKHRFWWAASMLLLIASCCAQPSTPPRESLLIGPGDLLHLTVFREPEMEQKVRVQDAGNISLELIGHVHVGGLTPAEAAQIIDHLYKSEGYLNHPQTSVSIDEYATQGVAVIGQVAKPGMQSVSTPLDVLDVISMAGGLTQMADRHILIRRKGNASTPVPVFLPNNARGTLEAARIMVNPGDTVVVPKAGIIYVLGDVGRPGGYVMQDDSQLTVLQALALASGVMKTASEQNTRLLHRANGSVTERKLPLKEMEQGKRPDIQLQADDVIYVPFSMVKNVALGATSIVASASSAAVYAVR